MSNSIAIYPRSLPEGSAEVLASIGFVGKVVASAEEIVEPDELRAVVIWLDDVDFVRQFCADIQSNKDRVPVLLIVPSTAFADLLDLSGFYSDFLVDPFSLAELRVRLLNAQSKTGALRQSDIVSYGPLVLDSATYQASVAGRLLDLTFLEYELLRFLVANPGQVFKREALLQQVWGFDYYGGARTVDVHVRRLRSKLGEEHSSLLQTVRSVGYKLGQSGFRSVIER